MHARIRAYGSLAAEVADAGVPGVVAMRYNVYVVTAAQYMADLYAHLLSGKTLGRAATAARRALADNPTRQIGPVPVALQDWAVPVVYEAAPLTLLEPQQRDAPLIHLTPADSPGAESGRGGGGGGAAAAGCRGSSAGTRPCWPWTGRSTPARSCCCTPTPGPGRPRPRRSSPAGMPPPAACTIPALGTGPVLWSSFEHHLPLDRLLDAAGDAFAALLEANGIHWQAITDPDQRRRPGAADPRRRCRCCGCGTTPSRSPGSRPAPPAPGPRTSRTRSPASCATWPSRPNARCCSTSRRDEQAWLGDLPARLRPAADADARTPPARPCAGRPPRPAPTRAPTGGRCCATPPATR